MTTLTNSQFRCSNICHIFRDEACSASKLIIQNCWVLYILLYRKYLVACVLTVFSFFYWRVLMAYVFSDYSGTVKCKISELFSDVLLFRIRSWLDLKMYISSLGLQTLTF
jgi:hypothetical protein